MSKDLIKVIRKLESIGLTKEAAVIKSSLLKSTASYDYETSSVGKIWLAKRNVIDEILVEHYFARKIDAEVWLKIQDEGDEFGKAMISEVDVEEMRNLNKTAMHLGEGYLTCDECGTRFSEYSEGSKTHKGYHVCKVCSGDVSEEEVGKRRSGAFESFTRRHRN